MIFDKYPFLETLVKTTKSFLFAVLACVAIFAGAITFVYADAPATPPAPAQPAAENKTTTAPAPTAETPTTAPANVSYVNKTAGFAINPPDFPTAAQGNFMPVAFTAPGRDGFGSNVNVMIQMQTGTRKQYIESARAEMRHINGKFNESEEIKEKNKTLKISGRDAAIIDYERTVNDVKLRFLALAVFDGEKYGGRNCIYLVTCSALASEFDAQKDEFMKCFESFTLLDTK